MRCVFQHCLASLMVTGLALSSLLGGTSSRVQADEPLAVVAISDLDRLFRDVPYLMRAAGVPEYSGLFTVFGKQYTDGLDTKRPLGASINLDEYMEPSIVAHLPLADRNRFFAALRQIGLVDDLGDDMFAVSVGPQSFYARQSGNWLHVAQLEEQLSEVPADPAAVLGDLGSRYSVAVQANLAQVPADLKDQLLEQIRMGFERSIGEPGSPEDEQARAMGEQSIQQLEDAINATKSLAFGFGISSADNQIFLELETMLVAGSELAIQNNQQMGMTSSFTSFQHVGEAISARWSGLVAPQQLEQVRDSLAAAKGGAMEAISENLPDVSSEDAALIEEGIDTLFRLLTQTFEAGSVDGGATFMVKDGLQVIAGGRLVGANDLPALLTKVADRLAGLPGVPTFGFFAGSHGGVDMHTINAPTGGEPTLTDIFGAEIEAFIGTSRDGIYFALGAGSDSLLKEAIDQAARQGAAPVSPLEAKIDIGQVLQYSQVISPSAEVAMVVDGLREASGKDAILISSSVVQNGQRFRLAIQDGLLRLIGLGVQMAGAQGFAPGF